ncbi:hypothetical protein BJ944DRAFT_133414 [Cunninghamella echinulata]|nr:hypothetical protein BJ944DRAFT_133414 [Cunninghamella echinulata]
MGKVDILQLDSQRSTINSEKITTTPNAPASPPSTPLACSPVPLSPSSTPSPSSSYSSLIRPSSSLSTTFRENIQVMIRCRPAATTSTSDKNKNNKMNKSNNETINWQVSLENGTIQINDANSTVFEYDKVIEGTDNNAVYESGIQALVR